MRRPGKFFFSVPFVFMLVGTMFLLSTTQATAAAPTLKEMSPLFAVAVSMHGNINYAGKTQEPFQILCTYCHSSHGGTGNLSTINTYVAVNNAPIILSGPIVFTARTGTNSFDDGISATISRICVTCHINSSRPGATTPMNHVGGAGHFSGDYSGQDCAVCHPHDPDGNPATVDGFMPLSGSCISCHNQTQGTRRQIVDSAGDGSGTGGDFQRTSHHVSGTGIPSDDDCKVCHEQSQHMQGKVRLYNADNSTTVYILDGINDPADYENFCLSCHDSNGWNGDTTPFSGTGTREVIDATSWNSASHNTNANVGSCVNCHDNGHGSNKVNLLAPWNYTNDGNADDPMKQQERFCYDCHDGSPAAVNVQAQFGLTSHHRIATTEQVNGLALECVSCHNPHTNNATNKVSNPDNLSQLATNNNTFCLTCHDNAVTSPLPAGVSFGTYTINGFLSGGAAGVWDKSKYVNSAHYTGDAALPNIQCGNCHSSHGNSTSGYQDLLKASYTRNVGASYYPPGGTGFGLCFGCHLWDDGRAGLRDVKNDAWAGEHGSHDDDGPCISCHDVHAPYDAGEFGLHSFEYNRLHGDLTYLTGYNASSAFDRNRRPVGGKNPTPGPCAIACHGVQHDSKDYTPPPDYDTTPVNVFPFSFNQISGSIYAIETAQGTITGTVNNPSVAMQNGYFNGNGVDTYIDFTNNPDALLASDTLVIETRVLPQGIPGIPVGAFRIDNTLPGIWTSILEPVNLLLTSPADEAVILDRGIDANYRISLIHPDAWNSYNAPANIASFALWVNPVNKHNGQDWKVTITNYDACPIQSNHWYWLRIQWDSSKPAKSPANLFVDDQGTTGDNSDELWKGIKDCTDWHPVKYLVPSDLQPATRDNIKTIPGNFTIGARIDTFANPFWGIIESILIYTEDSAKAQLQQWRNFPSK